MSKTNLLIIGNISTGKTTLGRTLCQTDERFSEDDHHTIDGLRKDYSDGTYAGEFLAWSKMLEYMQDPTEGNEIFEFSGTGKNAWFVKQIMEQTTKEHGVRWIVIYCLCNQKEILKRDSLRKYDTPMPYKFPDRPETVRRMGMDLKNKFTHHYWQMERIVVETDKYPPAICVKEVLKKVDNE